MSRNKGTHELADFKIDFAGRKNVMYGLRTKRVNKAPYLEVSAGSYDTKWKAALFQIVPTLLSFIL